MQIGIIGGGAVGRRLATLMTKSGEDVFIGVRNSSDAQPGNGYRVGPVLDAVASAEIVVLALPYLATALALPPLADTLAGKIVIDATNPLNDDWSPLLLGQETSAAEEIARRLPEARVVKVFNTVFADIMDTARLIRQGRPVTAFIAGDYPDANKIVADMAGRLGFAPLVTGPLKNARYLEAMAHLNISIALGGGGTNAAFLYDQEAA